MGSDIETQVSTAKSNHLVYRIELRGFPELEKRMLSAILRLTERRAISYELIQQLDQKPDAYLIHADDEAIVHAFLDEHASSLMRTPLIFIGRNKPQNKTPNKHQLELPFHAKPIDWMRLFEMLDLQMQKLVKTSARTIVDVPIASEVFMENDQRNQTVKPIDRVLVVDDSATLRGFMRIKLAPFHFVTDFAENGEQAIEMSQNNSYACIFLDILMSGIDGYEVCKRLKSDPQTKHSAIIMLTSKSNFVDKIRGTWAGCDEYLYKPISENALLSTIARFLPKSI
jgi:twitching motility two-component system response regulator PilG